MSLFHNPRDTSFHSLFISVFRHRLVFCLLGRWPFKHLLWHLIKSCLLLRKTPFPVQEWNQNCLFILQSLRSDTWRRRVLHIKNGFGLDEVRRRRILVKIEQLRFLAGNIITAHESRLERETTWTPQMERGDERDSGKNIKPGASSADVT